MRKVNTILTEINTTLETNLEATFENIKYWQEANRHSQDEKIFPVVSGGDGDGSIISFDDAYALQIYHRVLDVENIESENAGYGADVRRFRDLKMRLVGIGLQSKLDPQTWETNTDILGIVYNALPTDLTYELLIPGDEQPDKMEVMNGEFPGHNYDHLKFDLIAFWIEYTIRQRSENC